jgi:hypothetical protein
MDPPEHSVPLHKVASSRKMVDIDVESTPFKQGQVDPVRDVIGVMEEEMEKAPSRSPSKKKSILKNES